MATASYSSCPLARTGSWQLLALLAAASLCALSLALDVVTRTPDGPTAPLVSERAAPAHHETAGAPR